MQAARNFVGRGVKLSARVQHRHHHLRCGQALAVHVHLLGRNAAAVIYHRDGIVDVNGDVDVVGKSGEGFVHRIVHHFVNQVV